MATTASQEHCSQPPAPGGRLLPAYLEPNEGMPFWETYRVGDLIGVGSFSKVFACRQISTSKEFAVKVIALGGDGESDDSPLHAEATTLRETKRELEVLMAVTGVPGTVQMRDFFRHFEPDCGKTVLYIVMDLMKGSDLDDLLDARGSFAEDDAREIMRQVFAACRDLHARRVIHRDIKLENVMLSDPHVYDRGVKLVDFGLSVRIANDRERLSRCGTPYCIAPEVLSKQAVYGCEVDVWACGVMLYSLLCGFPPFFSHSITTLFRRITKRSLSFKDPAWCLISDSARDLVERCLTVDPDLRITAEAALNHPWMLGKTTMPGTVRRGFRYHSM